MSYLLNGKPVKVTLYIGVPFDNKYEHHLFREVPHTITSSLGIPITKNRVSMKSFLDVRKNSETQELKFDRLFIVGEYNFDYSNGLVTSLTLDVPKQYLNANYMLVEDTLGQNTFYYFITGYNISCVTETSVTAKFNLECDVIATYGKSFMEGILDKPLFTERKHSQRFSKTETAFECCDLSLSEDVTINCKPSVIKDVYDFKIKDFPTTSPLWCYITRTGDDTIGVAEYLGIDLPTTTFCFPVVDNVVFTFKDNTLQQQPEITHQFLPNEILKTIYDNPNVVGIKFSPFPPFNSLDGSITYTTFPNNNIRCDIYFNNVEYVNEVAGDKYFKLLVGDNVLTYFRLSETGKMCFVIKEQNVSKYELELIGDNSFLPIPQEKPTKTTPKNKILEPKLLFSPCTKYELYHRSGKPYEFYPEIVANNQPLTNNYEMFCFTTFSLIDNIISTYMKIGETYNTTWEMDKTNKGLILSNNYTFPSGQDALKTFQQTQQTQYFTSTLGSAIGSMIAIAGGVFSNNPVAVGLGAVGLSTSIGGAISKHNDLSNTPDQIVNVGSNVYQDITYYYPTKYENGGMLPKVVVSELTTSEQEMLLDYFYHNGYNTQRMCYFKTSLDYEDIIDNRLLTRTNFNYVKLNDNFRYHLAGSDIPPIVIEKLTNIFNNGITLWTLFNFGNARLVGVDTWENDVAPYFMKDTYENIEIDM